MNRVVISGMLHYLVCGYVAFVPFAGRHPVGDVHGGPLMDAIALSGPFLLGAGVGAILQAYVDRRYGSHQAVRLSLACLAIGVVLQASRDQHALHTGMALAGTLAGRLLAGIGLCGLWTPTAERTRQALSTTQRWFGMRVWTLMLFVGALPAVAVAQVATANESLSNWPTVFPVIVCAALMLWVPREKKVGEKPRVDALRSAITRPSDVPPQADSARPSREHVETDSNDHGTGEGSTLRDIPDNNCGADECCGGNREVLPVPLWIGVGLVAVGAFTLWGMFADLLLAEDAVNRVLLIAGAIVGVWLFQSTLPDTGYAVLLLPFLLTGIVSWLGLFLADGLRDWHSAVLLTGILLGAINYGCIGLACESFEATCHGVSQSSVFLMGHMAAAALLAAFTFKSAAMSFAEDAEYDVWRAIVFPAAIVMLRRIPGPVVSSRGRDETLDDDAEEAKAVLADAMALTRDSVP